jgi:hypothetical protein
MVGSAGVRAVWARRLTLRVTGWSILLSQVAIKGMDRKALQALSADVIGNLTAAQIGQFTVEQLKMLSKEQLAALTPEQLAALPPDVFQAMAGQILGAMSKDKLDSFTGAALKLLPKEMQKALKAVRATPSSRRAVPVYCFCPGACCGSAHQSLQASPLPFFPLLALA